MLAAGNDAVLQAPPGAGKTTLVPLALLDAAWLGDRKIIMLEPRRLAARASAHRMASLLNERVGETVGYRVRMDTKIGPRTRIEVVTEGVLTRMLQSDPSLEKFGCVIFDEFHERSLQADLGLALTLDARSAFRDDLRLVIMSATLDGSRVSALLGGVPVVTSEGRMYPVETHYMDRTPAGRIEDTAARVVRQALEETAGDVLVFLPGVGEIKRTEERLRGISADLRPLFGAQTFAQQDAAIQASPQGRRKVVLATDIAETSLTIEGVRVVVDAGLARAPLFDPASGMTRLVTRATSKASADQRRGRAGRLAPGTCYRLWTVVDQTARAEYAPPEILHADLTGLSLEVSRWGVTDPSTLRWLDPPEAGALNGARELLVQLGALDTRGSITAHGERMARLGLHPRLAHMLLTADEAGSGLPACDLAALLEERDPLRGRAHELPTDIRLRLQALVSARNGNPKKSVLGADLDKNGIRQILARSKELSRHITNPDTGRAVDLEAAGRWVAAAYPDRVAQMLSDRDGHFRLRNGRPVQIPANDPLAGSPFLAVASVGGGTDRHRAFMAAPLTAQDIEELFVDQIEEEDVIYWQSDADRVAAVVRRSLGAVILGESPLGDPNPTDVARVLLGEVAGRGLHLLPWDNASRQLQNRLVFLGRRDPEWPGRTDELLRIDLAEWLLPFVTGMKRLSDLRKLDLRAALLSGLGWDQRQELNRRAPSHLTVPSGSAISVDYSDPEMPVLAVRLQEVFGWTETPDIDGVPVSMHLLSPAHRPVQVTRDLKGFWESSYFDVRKDMRGRYPKHNWPENPLQATPTSRTTKPRD
ncbi:MAG: ATP-dependent helicase HrpB [Rhodothermales bacterium]